MMMLKHAKEDHCIRVLNGDSNKWLFYKINVLDPRLLQAVHELSVLTANRIKETHRYWFLRRPPTICRARKHYDRIVFHFTCILNVECFFRSINAMEFAELVHAELRRLAAAYRWVPYSREKTCLLPALLGRLEQQISQSY
jgi:hypothetical protein